MSLSIWSTQEILEYSSRHRITTGIIWRNLPAVDTASLPDVSIKTANAEFKTSDLVGTRVKDEHINGMMQLQMTYEDDYEDNVSRDSLMSRLIEEDGESDMRLIE